MNFNKLYSFFADHQYVFAKNSNPQYTFFVKNSDENFSAIILVDDIKYKTSTDPLVFDSIRESIEKTFLLRGYKDVNVLFVILTKNPFAYKSFADSEFIFWISDVNSGRIISYSENDGYFDNIRNDLETCFSEPEETGNFTKRLKHSRFFALPIFTILFALVNICIFIYMDIFCDPMESTLMLAKYASEWNSILEGNEYYRLITSTFIHFNFDHLFSNMITLFAIGYHLEPAIGHIKFSIIYMLSGLSASICSVLYYSSTEAAVLSAGASGAIFGIFGAYAVYALFDSRRQRSVPFSRVVIIALLMIFNGMVGESVDNAAHLGGIIFGSIIAFICCICQKNKI